MILTLSSLVLFYMQMYSFRVVYLFSWDPHKDVTFTIHRDSHYSFLPDWYVRELTKTHHHAQPQS